MEGSGIAAAINFSECIFGGALCVGRDRGCCDVSCWQIPEMPQGGSPNPTADLEMKMVGYAPLTYPTHCMSVVEGIAEVLFRGREVGF
jgi:hypothetical protein